MHVEARLVHAEAGRRVVEVRALAGGTCLGSALGEADHAEEAEERALRRLLQRLESAAAPKPGAADRAAQPPGTGGCGPSLPLAAAAPAPATAPEGRPRAAAPRPIATAATDRDGNLLAAAASGPAPSAPAAGAPLPAAAPSPAPAAAMPAPGSMPAVNRSSTAPEEPPADPEDWSAELARLDLALRRIGWSRDQEAAYLQRAFGHPSRSRLTSYADLVAYLTTLDGLEVGQDPAVVPVPLRRRDLLAQCDGLLEQLGWDDERGRAFLATQLGASSRRQLSDSQLLQFNMLLEGALIAARSDGVPPPGP
jgi:hypothetical protein